MPTENMWLHFFQNAGFAAVTLMALGVAIWKTGKWIGSRIEEWVTPLVKAHLQFIADLKTELKDHQEAQTNAIKIIQKQQEVQTQVMQSLQNQQEVQTSVMSKQTEAVGKIIQRLEVTEKKNI